MGDSVFKVTLKLFIYVCLFSLSAFSYSGEQVKQNFLTQKDTTVPDSSKEALREVKRG